MSEISTEDLLSDKDLTEVEAEETTEASTEEQTTVEESETEESADKSGEAKDEESEKKEDSTTESEASETAEEEQPWTYKAVKDERSKRQQAEAKAKELEEKLQQFNGGQQQEKQQPEQQKKPDWFNDPETAAQQQQQQMQQALFEQRAIMGQELMRSQHDDFDEMETKFFQMIEENPHLGEGMRSAANPAKYAYETAKKAMEAEALKDVDGYKARLREEVRKEEEAKIREEYEAKLKKQQEKDGAILPSLSDTPSRGGLKSDDWSGPTPLEDILK